MRRGIGDNIDFGPLFKPLARTSDPQTSKLAADKLVKSGKQARQVDLVADAVARYPGLTYTELANKPGVILNLSQLSKRIPDAARMGLIESKKTRLCSVTGNDAATWRIVK